MSVFLVSHWLMRTSSSCITFWEKEKWTWQQDRNNNQQVYCACVASWCWHWPLKLQYISGCGKGFCVQACDESRQSLHLHPSQPYCRHKETWKTTKTLDGRHQRLDQTTSGWVRENCTGRTEWHGVQRCHWLWPSTLGNEEEPVQSCPVRV